MTLPLPNLAKESFEDLRKDALASIPKYTTRWTNLNPSDPGVTLIELLCWITENLLYRVNRIPDETYLSFLKLVTGVCLNDPNILLKNMAKQENKASLDINKQKILEFLAEIHAGEKKKTSEIKSATLNFIQSRYRAITEQDFIELALESTSVEYWSGRTVKRALVRTVPDSGLVIVTVVAEGQDDEKPLLEWVEDYLSARKLVGTRIQVVEPVYTPLDIAIDITVLPGFVDAEVAWKAVAAIEKFISPVCGGPDGKGWPLERSLSFYELAAVIENVEGVERTEAIKMNDEPVVFIPTEGLFQLGGVQVRPITQDFEEDV